MSTPFAYCLVSKAGNGDVAAYEKLREIMRYNLKCGHWSMFPCQCQPTCPELTEEQARALDAKLRADLADVKCDGESGAVGEPGDADG